MGGNPLIVVHCLYACNSPIFNPPAPQLALEVGIASPQYLISLLGLANTLPRWPGWLMC